MPIPLENLDDMTYEELVRDALTRIPVYAPRWTDRNKTDPGVTFIELFAWLIEMQIYSLNRIDDKSRLKFLKLLGVPRPYPPMPAEANITFMLKGDSPITVPPETAVASYNKVTGELISFETVSEVSLSSSIPATTVHAVQWTRKSKEFQSDGLPNQLLRLDESIFIRASETVGDGLSVFVNETTWEYREDFDGSNDKDTHFIADFEAGTITFGDGEHGKIPRKGKITVSYRTAAGSRGNVRAEAINRILDVSLASDVEAINSEAAIGGTDASETLESAIGRARRDLKEVTRAVTASDYEHLALTCPGVDLARARALEMYHPSHEDRLHTVVSVVIVPKTGLVFCWDEIPGQDKDKKRLLKFLAWKVGWTEKDFNVEKSDDKIIKVSNEKKSIFLTLSNNKDEVILEIKDTESGRLSAEKEDGKLKIYDTNVKFMQKGFPCAFCWDDIPEKDEEKRKLLEFLALKFRIGWTEDAKIEKINNNTIRVYTEKGSNDDKPYSISLDLNTNEDEVILKISIRKREKLTAEMKEGKLNVYGELAKPDPEEISLIGQHLERYRLMGTELFVIPPDYLQVKVETEVTRDPRYLEESVTGSVKSALGKFLNPRDGGGPDGDGWPFGRSVYLSEVEQVIDGSAGVDHVVSCRLYGWREAENGLGEWVEFDEKIPIPAHSLVYSLQDDHVVTIEKEYK